jgi:hypothetical protein
LAADEIHNGHAAFCVDVAHRRRGADIGRRGHAVEVSSPVKDRDSIRFEPQGVESSVDFKSVDQGA